MFELPHFNLVALALAVLVQLVVTWHAAKGRYKTGIADTQLFFRTSGAASLTATETSATLTINGTPQNGLMLEINIPKYSIGDTVQATLNHSTDNSTFTTLLPIETVASQTGAKTTPSQIRRIFHTRFKYVQLVWTVAGTSPDFGIANAFITAAGQWNVLGVGANPTTPQPQGV